MTHLQKDDADMSKITDARLERVLDGLPPNDRPDGYPRQTMVQVAWLRDALTELRALRSKSEAVGVKDIAKAFHDGPLMADDHDFTPDDPAGKWCIEVAQFFVAALTHPAPATVVSDAMVERALRAFYHDADGVLRPTSDDDKDDLRRWTSDMRAALVAALTEEGA